MHWGIASHLMALIAGVFGDGSPIDPAVFNPYAPKRPPGPLDSVLAVMRRDGFFGPPGKSAPEGKSAP